MNSFQHENPNDCFYFSSVFTTDSEHRNKHLGQGIEHDAHRSLSTRERATITILLQSTQRIVKIFDRTSVCEWKTFLNPSLSILNFCFPDHYTSQLNENIYAQMQPVESAQYKRYHTFDGDRNLEAQFVQCPWCLLPHLLKCSPWVAVL